MEGKVQKGAGYYFDIDVLRALLMSLGVVLHAAVYFSGAPNPKVDLGFDSRTYGLVVEIIHLFRMESFFIIAGFFAAMILHRYTVSELLRRRAVKLLVPMLACALTTNVVMGFLNQSGDDIENPLHPLYWLSGQWLAHLWFLPILFIYTAALAFVNRLGVDLNQSSKQLSPAVVCALLYAAYPAAVFLLLRIAWRLHIWPWGEQFLGLIEIVKLFEHSIDFAIGVGLWKFGLLRKLSTDNAMLGFHVLAGAAFAIVYFSHIGPANNAYVHEILNHWIALPMAFALMGLFEALFSAPRAWTRYFAELSYSVYLFHMPILTLIATALKPIGLDSMHLAFTIMVGVALIASAAVHELVTRYPVAALLFNGTTPRHHLALGRRSWRPQLDQRSRGEA